MRSLRLGCAIGALMVASTAVYAQETTGTIRGDVTDSAGNAVPNATVTITHTPSGSRSTSTTNNEGSFNSSGLRVGGPYEVTVAAPGLESVTDTIPAIAIGEAQRVDVTLFSSAETITVTGARRTSTITLATGPQTTLDAEDIAGVASVSRDIRDIARRDPFVTIDQSNSRTIEIAGQNGRLNRFSVDGVQFSDDFGLNNGGLPTSRGPVPFDAVEQLSVSIAPFDISEGDFQGGAVNVVLRSGDNDFTGSAFYAYTDDSLTGDKSKYAITAANPNGDINLKFDSKQYGAFLAGPIVKDKLFFAFAYEKLEETDPVDDGPTGLGFSNSIPRVTQGLLDQISGIASSVYQYDTLGVLQNAVENDEKYTAKIDWNITDDHRASFTYIHNEGSQQFTQNTVTQDTNPTFGFRSNGYELIEEVNSGVFQVNSTWSDSFSTEFRAAYRDTNRDQTPFGGRNFAQFEVCTDPTTSTAASNVLTSCTLAAPGATPPVLATPRLFFGPDVSRQANDLNTENLSFDFSATLEAGIHTFKGVVEYTDIDVFNLFVQQATGNYYFDSIADLQARRASRVRLGGAVSGNLNDAAASFDTQTYTFGLQDQIDVADNLELSLGLRYDLFGSNSSVPLNANFLARYGFANTQTFKGQGVLQPRFGFNYQPTDRLILRGGVGLFAGGTPDVFLSNSYSNTGQLTNQIDISRNTSAAGCNVTIAGATAAQLLSFCNAALVGVNGTTIDPQVTNFLQTNTASLAAAPVNAVDPDFDLPSQWRATLSANYEADLGGFLGDGWLLGADLVYGEAHRALTYVDLRSVAIASTAPDGRQRYNAFGGTATTNQDLVLTNDNRGRSILAVARVSKEWDNGLSADLSYTWQDIEDVNAITSATAGSLYGNTAFRDPGNAEYGTSIYQIRNSVKLGLDYKHAFFGDNETRFSLFGEYRSGRPFSYTFRDPATGRSPVFGTNGASNRYLLYVPNTTDTLVSFDSVATQTAFNAFVDGGKLAGYRGQITPKNIGRSPSIWKLDLHVDQELPVPMWDGAKFKVFADIENVLNMIDSDWGAQRQVAFPYFANLVNVQCLTAPVATGTAPPATGAGSVATLPTQACAQYRYSSFSAPTISLQNQNRQSLYAIRVGVRFEF